MKRRIWVAFLNYRNPPNPYRTIPIIDLQIVALRDLLYTRFEPPAIVFVQVSFL